MKNFDAHNYFIQQLQIFPQNHEITESNTTFSKKPDIQLLPESGHFLSGVVNTVGIVAKDGQGRGIPNLNIELETDEGITIAKTTLNQMGLGRIAFIPSKGNSYTIKTFFAGKYYDFRVTPTVNEEGITLSASEYKGNLNVAVNTNSNTLKKIKQKQFYLTLKSRNRSTALSFNFENRKTVPIAFPLDSLSSGIQVLTIFNSNFQPLAERLFFNYQNLPLKNLEKHQLTSTSDSLKIKFSNISLEQDSLSASIALLPSNSISYNPENSLISQVMLQPYIKGDLENGNWYFDNTSKNKRIELDNLLLTQGWSSYNWENIFKKDQKYEYSFEQYTTLTAQINNKPKKRLGQKYLLHATSTNIPAYSDIPLDKESFKVENFIPMEGDSLYVSQILPNKKLQPAELSYTIYPSKIPTFNIHYDLNPKTKTKEFINTDVKPFVLEKDVEKLDEVVVKSKLDKKIIRTNKLEARSFGDIHILTPEDKIYYNTLSDYLMTKPGIEVRRDSNKRLRVYNYSKKLTLSKRTNNSKAHDQMQFYINDRPVYSEEMLITLPFNFIDYIEINRSGLGESSMAGAGSIKIYMDYSKNFIDYLDVPVAQNFKYPLYFSKEKKYYVPKYQSNTDEFFQKFGVIDWKGNLETNDRGEVVITIKKPAVNFRYFIQGITSNGQLIDTQKEVILYE